MGRDEKPLDPSAGPVQRFASQLRALRSEAGRPTYREMARKAGYSSVTLSTAAAGDKLPSLPVVLAYVAACEGEQQQLQEWERRWRVVRQEAAACGDDEDRLSPYRGLARFEVEDRDLFFGRDRLIADLAALAAAHRCAAVIGPSGSGKSSLFRAGLVPQLGVAEADEGRRPFGEPRILVPGPHPLYVHQDVLVPGPGGGDTWLVVDQFEEVFTLCSEAREREAFIEALLAAQDPASGLRVVLGIRADFYGRCLQHPGLAAMLREASLPVGPMSADELRQAIVKPATARGLFVERALTERLATEAAGEPGGLPLMSHALLETWRRRRGRTLTLEGYEDAGGLHGAIAQTAERFYTQLTVDHAAVTRRILLRLVTPGEGAPDTRRRADRAELEAAGDGAAADVVEGLVQARLLTLESDSVDLAHEALLSAWPRLRGWIEEDRERLRLHRKLTEAAQAWADLGQDSGALYRGVRLTAAEEAFTGYEAQTGLTSLERDFLATSSHARDAEQQAAVRATRRLRGLAITLSVLLILALAATVAAWDQYRTGEQHRRQALAARQTALSRQLAAQSANLLNEDPDLASLLAVHAYRSRPTAEATASLYTAAALPLRRRLAGDSRVGSVAFSANGRTVAVGNDDGSVRLWDVAKGTSRAISTGAYAVKALAFSPRGRTLAVGDDAGKVRLWDATTGKARATLTGAYGVKAVAFSPDGRILAVSGAGARKGDAGRLWDVTTGKIRRVLPGVDSVWSVAFSRDGRAPAVGDDDGEMRLWDATTGKARATLTGAYGVEPVAFSPDGRTLAVGGGDGSVRLWDATTGKARAALTGSSGAKSLSFSPDSRTLAVGGDDGKVRLWNVPAGQIRATLTGHGAGVQSMAFSPDGRSLASGSDDGTVRLWKVPVGQVRATLTGSSRTKSVAFSPDGRTLAASGDDGWVRLWDAATGKARATLTGSSRAKSVTFSPDGRTLAASGDDGKVRLWNVPARQVRATLVEGARMDSALAFSPNGRILATGSDGSSDDNRLRLWDVSTGSVRATLTGHSDGVWSVAFSPDGRILAAGGGDGSVRLWDVTTGKVRTAVIGTASMWSVAFSPNGRTLAVGGDDGKVRLWDVHTGAVHAALTGHGDAVESVAFSPDGRTLASGSNDHTVRLWDVNTGRIRITLAGHSDGVQSVAFSPDGRILASGSNDHTVRLWNISLPDPARAINTICRAISRNMTPQESSTYLQGQSLRHPCRS
ncbi:hypothetical protein ACFZCY_43140 [Streptomyces sp. NPDC007983]|uniref:nSTAND1 domain-containing NTPase n=1 Tax=Streptomyces sp. NPDC007983 TaxID=3364800 RepID=UPI0036E4F32B